MDPFVPLFFRPFPRDFVVAGPTRRWVDEDEMRDAGGVRRSQETPVEVAVLVAQIRSSLRPDSIQDRDDVVGVYLQGSYL